MASNSAMFSTILVTSIFLSFLTAGSYSATFKVVNKCGHTVWPTMVGTPPISTTSFTLYPGDSNTIPMPPTWTGLLWGRTFCSHDIAGKFSCVTGDCSSSTVECAGGKVTPPVNKTEFSLNSSVGMDLYYVSLDEGFNLPVEVKPYGGTGKCKSTGSMVNLNDACPTQLTVTRGGEAVACKNACELTSQFCCNRACNFSCANSDYLITFCPTSSSTRVGKHPAPVATLGGHDDKEGSGNSNNLMELTKKKIVLIAAVVVSILGLTTCTITVTTKCCSCTTGVKTQAKP